MDFTTIPITKTQKEFLLVLGYLYLQNGKFYDSKIVFEALLLFYPKDHHIMRSLAYAYLCDGDYEQALEINEQFKHAQMSPKDHAFFNLLKSKALWRIGKLQEAKQYFNEFVQIHKTLS